MRIETVSGPRTAGRGRGKGLVRSGAGLLAVIALLGLFAPWIAPYDPREQLDVPAGRHQPPLTSMLAVETAEGRWYLADRVERTVSGLRIERLGEVRELAAHEVVNLTADGVADRRFFLLGSDRLGRDIFSRIVHGARISLAIGFLSVALALVLGVGIGSLAALGPRLVDVVLMRCVEGMIAFPWLVLLLVLAALFPTGTGTLILILGGTSWMMIARLSRGEILSLVERDFIVAARGLGASPGRVLLHHLLPNAMTPLAIAAALQIGGLILAEAALSFLGFGIQPPDPSWGNMIAESRHHLTRAWWEGVFPGVFLVLTVIASSLLADGLRDVLDPHAAGSHETS